MKITCSSVDDFLENLNAAAGVHRNTVHYDRTDREVSDVCDELFYQVSAIIEFADDTQALLEVGVNCGIDTMTRDGETEGTTNRGEMHKTLEKYCEAHDLKLLPGILDA